jgi:hypothetical protein
MGALDPVELTLGNPIAHFTVSDISSGFQWYDKIGYEFDPTWETLAPFHRTEKVRPYDTPEALGYAPVTIGFTAVNSISAVTLNSSNWSGISEFEWSFGDGTIVSTQNPTVEHSYGSAGRFKVTLTVRNVSGNTDSIAKTFRVLGDGDAIPPASPFQLRFVNN